MTDTTETMNAAAEDQAEEVTQPDPAETEDDGKPGREAARYRRQLREAEAERDELRGQVETLRRAQAEKLAQAQGLTAAALWSSGVSLEDLTAEDGTIDPASVTVAVKTAREAFGILPVTTAFAAGALPPIPPQDEHQAFERAFGPNHSTN